MNPESHRRFRPLIPLVFLAFLALITWAVRSLWNGVLTDVLSVKTISYWQALGLLLLARILFGDWPGGMDRGFGARRRARLMAKRWESLNPEQRERMREEMRCRYGDWPRPSFDQPQDGPSEGPAKSVPGFDQTCR